MINRIDAVFQRCRRENRKALIVFVTAGDPDLAATRRLLPALADAGADIIELGVPFSDPMADGPTIQAASQRALAAGATPRGILDVAREVRSLRPDLPLVLFSYYNVILQYGVGAFAADSSQAGIDGWLIVDLPSEEAAEVRSHLERCGLYRIPLAAPTTPPERFPVVLDGAGGFVYYITVTGVTGARRALPDDLIEHVAALRQATDLPIAAGFGISSPEMARAAARYTDGVVVGSALIDRMANAPGVDEGIQAAAAFVASLAQALRDCAV